MKNKTIIFTVVILIAAISNYFIISSDGNIRILEFLSIFAIALVAGVLLTRFIKALKNKN